MRKLAQSQISPSPKSSPADVPPSPSLDSISPPAPISELPNESNSTDDKANPDQLFGPPLPSIFPPPLAPTLESSPPPIPANSPPAPTTSSPPPPSKPDGPPPASAPPLVPGSPPPKQSPPPRPLPNSPPPLPSASSPPPPSDATLSPPAPSPPKDATSPPPAHTPPPLSPAVPPPKSSPPPSPADKPSPPPPADKPRSPPPAPAERPTSPPPVDKATSPPPSHHSPPPHHSHPPPPHSPSAPPPTVTVTPPPPPGHLPPWPHPSSPPPPTTNTSEVGVPPKWKPPTIPKEKPTANPTNDNGELANTSSNASGGLSSGGATAIGVVVAFVCLGLIAMAVFFVWKRKKRESKRALILRYQAASPFSSPNDSGSYLLRPPASLKLKGTNGSSKLIHPPSEQGGLNESRSWFTYKELAHATDWFSDDNELGEGGFGKVYKGVLADGREVAVKQLKVGSGQGEREFRAEVDIISRIHHRHLVSLVGYCISESQRLLVYDFVQNNTLEYHIHSVGRPVMEWSIRVKAAAGAARGLAYLHEDCTPRIIHRDIKSANILLDNNYDAKVADFGLAKLAMELESQTHVSTRVMGTFGYMAPEYATTGKLTEKSDVYSFGVVLLELITGHKPVDDSGSLGDESLVEWARPRLAQALENEVFEPLVDPRLERNYSASEMFRMVEAAAACVRHQATRRPKMSQIVRALDSIGEESNLPNGMKFGQSEVIDSAEYSAQIRRFQRMAFGSESSQEYTSSHVSDSQSSWRL